MVNTIYITLNLNEQSELRIIKQTIRKKTKVEHCLLETQSHLRGLIK